MCWYYTNAWADLPNAATDRLKVKTSHRSCLLDLLIKNDESSVHKYDKYLTTFRPSTKLAPLDSPTGDQDPGPLSV